MPVIKKLYNFNITNETDQVVEYRDYKNRSLNLVGLQKITAKFYEQLEELLEPTGLDITFDAKTHTMMAFGMEFLLTVGQTYDYNNYVNIHPFCACQGDITPQTSLQSCRLGGKYSPGSTAESRYAEASYSIGPKGNMLSIHVDTASDKDYFFQKINNSEYLNDQLSLAFHISEFPTEYSYTIIIYYNTNYCIVQYESSNGVIVPVFCIIKGKTYDNSPVLLMSYDINSNGNIQTSNFDDNGMGISWYSKCKIRFIGHQYDSSATYMIPGIPEWRDIDPARNDDWLHSGSVRNWRGLNKRSEDEYNRVKNIKFYDHDDCRGMFTKIVFDYSPSECTVLGINDGKLIMCPPICMGGLITFDNMWCVPETTIKNKILSIDGDNYVVPCSSTRHRFSWTQMGRWGGDHNAQVDQFYMFKL